MNLIGNSRDNSSFVFGTFSSYNDFIMQANLQTLESLQANHGHSAAWSSMAIFNNTEHNPNNEQNPNETSLRQQCAKSTYYQQEMMALLEEQKQKIDALKGQGLSDTELAQKINKIMQEFTTKHAELEKHLTEAGEQIGKIQRGAIKQPSQ